MSTDRRPATTQPGRATPPRRVRRRLLGLAIATGVAASAFAAVAPGTAQAAPRHLAPAETSTWG